MKLVFNTKIPPVVATALKVLEDYEPIVFSMSMSADWSQVRITVDIPDEAAPMAVLPEGMCKVIP